MATASSISDALINNLSAASAIGGCQVATHYKIMESVSACCGVVQYLGETTERVQFSNERETLMIHALRLYVKDNSRNATVIERRLQELRDKTACSLWTDPNLQHGQDPETVTIQAISFIRDIDIAFDAAGHTWYLIDGQIETLNWPDNA